MENYNQEKQKQLGMSIGKANNRLRKKILFSLIKACGLDNCYRCNKIIDEISDLSIEHIKPWLHSENPSELYFDLDNIAFSHLSCNSACARKPNQITNKVGYLWCWRCQQYKKIEEFPPSAQNNRVKDCTKCYSSYRSEYRNRTGKR